MPRAIPWRKLVSNFRLIGFEGPFSGGRHLFMIKGKLKIHIPNPHQGDISAALVSEILRQAGISKRDWDNL